MGLTGRSCTRLRSAGFLLMILKTKRLWLLLAGVLLRGPGGGPGVAPREAAKIEFGPLALYPTLQILNAGVDDNVFNDASAPQRDYTMTVESRVLSVLRLGSNELLFQVGSDYVWFNEFSSERSNNPRYACASTCRPAGSSRSSVPSTSARASAAVPRLTPARAASTATRWAAWHSKSHRARPSPRRSGSTKRTTTEGESFRGVALDDELNRSGRGADAGVRYAITPLTTMSVTAGYEEQKFKQSHLRDLKRYMVGPTFEFSPEAAIRGRASQRLSCSGPKTRPWRKARASPTRRRSVGRSMDGRRSSSKQEEISAILIKIPNPTTC